MSVRLVVAVLLLGVIAGGLWWTASLAPGGGEVGQGEVHVVVVGPDGDIVANGTLVSRATPYDALLALAHDQGLAVEVEQQTWIGEGCTAAYVVGIAGHRESVTGGWNYYTRHPGQQWTWRSEGAACYALSFGEQVEWCWVEADVCKHHAS